MFLVALESFLRYNKKGAAVEIQVKKVRAFHPGTEFIPGPGITSPVVLYTKMLFTEYYPETVFKRFGAPVNNSWQDIPENDHHNEPEQGTDEESKGGYLFKIE